MNWFLQDVRYALRQMRKSPGFTAVVVLTLALGIGANSAIFSVIEAVIVRPLSYQDPNQLARLRDSEDADSGGFLLKDIGVLKSETRSFRDLAFYYRDSGFSRVTLTGTTEPESVQGAFVSSNFFPVMGIRPALGRAFTPEEESRRERVVVLSHGLWMKRFGGSPDVRGQTLEMDGVRYQIIGVMPPTFQFPASDQQFWAPVTTNRYWQDPELTKAVRDDSAPRPKHARTFYERWQAIGRLSSGRTLGEAQSEISTIFSRLAQSDPDTNRGPGIEVVRLSVLLRGNTRSALLILFGAVVFVLLIASSNVANLMLARRTAREQEIAVRTALGAGTRRLLSQFLTESVLLALFAGAAGLALAFQSLPLVIRLAPPSIPRIGEARLDPVVLAFTAAICLLTALVFGLAPAWKISQKESSQWLKTGARTGSRLRIRARSTLVVVEFALSLVLLAAAGLLVRSFLALRAVDPGFKPERVLTMNVSLPPSSSEPRSAFYEAVLDRVRNLPGVEAAGQVDSLFELGNINNLGLRAIEGRTPERTADWTPLIWVSIRGEYFQAMGTRLIRGRYFTAEDLPHSPLVAILDESMARRYWPGEDPIGKHFKGQDPRGQNDDWLTVVGVVRDMRTSGLERAPIPHVFEPSTQAIDGDRTAYLLVRTTGDPLAIAADLRRLVRGLGSRAILSPVSTLEDELSEQLTPRRFQTSLLAGFAAMALGLAALGIFGLMHYSVSQRTEEFGVRGALGARREDILRQVLAEAAKFAILGVVIGCLVALLLSRFMVSLVFGVRPTDPVTFIAAPLVLVMVALLASLVPAWRATRVDPMSALRCE